MRNALFLVPLLNTNIMKPFLKRIAAGLTLIVILSALSGCFMFRKKNRCGDCPKWSKMSVPASEALFRMLAP
jgi:hypothetical protein